MTYVLSTAKLDAMGHRWVAGLAIYNFYIHYKSWKNNVEADALSRIDWEKCDETIQANSIQAIVAAALAGDRANYIESVPCSVQTIDFLFPSISNTPAISKAITRSSGQSSNTSGTQIVHSKISNKTRLLQSSRSSHWPPKEPIEFKVYDQVRLGRSSI